MKIYFCVGKEKRRRKRRKIFREGTYLFAEETKKQRRKIFGEGKKSEEKKNGEGKEKNI